MRALQVEARLASAERRIDAIFTMMEEICAEAGVRTHRAGGRRRPRHLALVRDGVPSPEAAALAGELRHQPQHVRDAVLVELRRQDGAR